MIPRRHAADDVQIFQRGFVHDGPGHRLGHAKGGVTPAVPMNVEVHLQSGLVQVNDDFFHQGAGDSCIAALR
jgi:hypothetical protein